MKKSIALKLFILTVSFFIMFITLQLLFQSLYFENFYTGRKTSNLKNNLESFEKNYVNNIGNIEETLNTIRDFEEENNAKIVILESNGLLSYLTEQEDKERSTNSINIIKLIIQEWTSNPKAFLEMQRRGKTITYTFDNPSYNTKNIVCLTPVNINGITSKVIFAVSSLQPVDEAVRVIREFNTYIYVFAMLIILILAYVYSKMISKPLIKLNKAAMKMAKQDFSEECEVTSEDEIGNLARTLNFLSHNLKKALSSLKKSNEQLKKDIEREREMENIRKEFVAAVSHELKTPISLIEGYAEGIKDGIVQGEDKDYYLDVIIDEAEKMGRLVSDMLELSRLEAGNFRIKIDKFFLGRTINESIKRLEGIKLDKDSKHTFNIISNIDEDTEVLGDENNIEKVIINFLTNAIRHTKEEGNIYVRTYIKGNLVFVEVENEGEHIKGEDLIKIWDRFYKVDKSRSRKLGGTGLGLSIAKNILELHNSSYGAENTEIGVKFYFSLEKNK